jgi:tRNA threonylcarbamoyladenosine biosynthesis protein TsaB
LARVKLRDEDEHAALLTPAVDEVLNDAGARLSDLVALVVGSGPGSFTGVRVAAATAKALAWSLGLPLWAFSSLAGAAAAVEEEPTRPRMVLFDARGNRVYAAAYRLARGRLETLLEPVATDVDTILDHHLPPRAVLMGSGAFRHRDLFQASGSSVLRPPAGDPEAQGLLRLLVLTPEAQPVGDLGAWEPDYLREAGAERLRKERKARKGRKGR